MLLTNWNLNDEFSLRCKKIDVGKLNLWNFKDILYQILIKSKLVFIWFCVWCFVNNK